MQVDRAVSVRRHAQLPFPGTVIGLTRFWCMLVALSLQVLQWFFWGGEGPGSLIFGCGGMGVQGLFFRFVFLSFFLSQPLIMSDVNDVILLEIDRCLNYTKCERIK